MGKVKFDKLLGKPVMHTHDPLYLTDSNGVTWTITIDTDGTIITTSPIAGAGNPMGLLLTLTYAS